MSFLAPMTSASSGAGFQGQTAEIQTPTTNKQAEQQYKNAQQALSAQTGLVGQLQGQNGIQNQSNVFNQQQALANQLQAQTMGGGPNPAQAALAQNTAANTANQAALMASSRGTSANPGMIARQAAQQGAANQQASIGQAATMQAQQQLAAQQQLMGQQAQMSGTAGTQVGQLQNAIGAQNQYAQNEQQNILNAIAQQNAANVGMTSNINQVNAGIAQGNQAFQQGLTNKVGGVVAQGAMMMADGGLVRAEGGPNQVPYFSGQMSAFKDNSEQMNKDIASGQKAGKSMADWFKGAPIASGSPGDMPGQTSSTFTQAPMAGGAMDAGGMGAMPMAKDGGSVGQEDTYSDTLVNKLKKGAQNYGKEFQNLFKKDEPEHKAKKPVEYAPGSQQELEHRGEYSKGGKVDVMVSPGEKLYSPGGKVSEVEGKAKVAGDSYENDTVHKKLKKGTIVVPRSAAKDPEKSKKFVAAILARRGR